MKTINKIGLIVIFFFVSVYSIGQSINKCLKGSDFVKGLENKEYLRGLLLENQFSILEKGKIDNTIAGYYDNWDWGQLYYINIMATPGKLNQIYVRIHEVLTGTPEYLMIDIKRLFPIKEIEKKDDIIAIIDSTLICKETRSLLTYSRNADNVQVIIWFDSPYYCFRFDEIFTDSK